jgi:diguanylate cyclase (GGDEF)-like protein/PAS domain S-box-containing protein
VKSERFRPQSIRVPEHTANTIISSIGEGIIVYDGELRCQLWNAFMEEITGIPAERVMGERIADFSAHVRENGAEKLLQRALSGECVRSEDMPYYVAETGRSGWVIASYTPLVVDGEITGVVAVVHDVTERKRGEEQLRYHAFHDYLTGLPNRALFMDRLDRLIKHAQRHPEYTFAVLFLDIDCFKAVNDSFGHSVGDDLLIAMGRRLEACLREGDSVGRLGGDEFAVLLADVRDLQEASQIAERIERALAAPFLLRGHEVFTSASIGISVSSSEYAGSGEMLRDADAAMYRAKSNAVA